MLLLSMFQQFRLIRERNQLQLQVASDTRKLDRIEKNIKNRQKYYAAQIERAKQQGSRAQTQFNNWLQQSTGIFSQSLYPNMTQGFGGVSAFVNKYMEDAFGQQLSTGQEGQFFDNEHLKALYQAKLNGTLVQNAANGQLVSGQEWKINNTNQTFSNAEYNMIQSLMSNANYIQQVKMQENSAMSSQFASNISIWQETEVERLEAEQDMMLEPLMYEQTMLEIDKEYRANRLERIKAELEAYKQQAQESAQEAAPKFGLS